MIYRNAFKDTNMEALFISNTAVFEGFYAYSIHEPADEFSKKLHYHNFYELQIHFSDTGSLTIGNKKYDLHSGDLAFINIFEPHAFLPRKDTYEHLFITLEPSFLLAVCSNKSNLLSLWNKKNKCSPVFNLNGDTFKIITGIIDELRQTKFCHGQDLLERALIHKILAHLYNYFFDDDYVNDIESQHTDIIARLIRFIASHLNEELSLERLSAEVNLSTFHICRIFKKYAGSSITKYIISNRIEKSKCLLWENTSLEKISAETGFNNYPNFYKTFKKLTGYSPMDYRKRFCVIC
jgi:AraC-like DNA-binding protein